MGIAYIPITRLFSFANAIKLACNSGTADSAVLTLYNHLSCYLFNFFFRVTVSKAQLIEHSI